MASMFCFRLLTFVVSMAICGSLRFPIKDLSEIPELQKPFVCGSVNQCEACEQCGDMCIFYNNSCCGENSTASVPALKEWQYSCVRTFPDMERMPLDCSGGGSDAQGVFMVTKCSKTWAEREQRFNCEEDNDSLLSRIPVYENISELITYKNVYCALCNDIKIQHIMFWEFQIQCNFTENLDIVSNFDKDFCVTYLFPKTRYWICANDMIETCPEYYSNFSIYNIKDRCEKGETGPIYVYDDYYYKAYKNHDCYICNVFNLTENDIRMMFSGVDFGGFYRCDRPNTCYTPVPSYSLKQLVNLNIQDELNSILLLGNLGGGNLYSKNTACNSSENNCAQEACEFVEIHKAVTSLNDTTLYVIPINAYFATDMFYINGTNVHVCLNKIQREYLIQEPSENKLENVITFVGLLTSITCLVATFCHYLCLRQLRNGHGHILMNLMVSLFCAQSSFLVSFHFQNIASACVIFGIVKHYFFLAAFCSMNAVGFDSFKTFSNAFVQGNSSTRVFVSVFYSWSLPFVIVLSAVILEYADLPESTYPFRPEYGKDSCWINSSKALLTFFVVPLAVFKMVDIALFAATAVAIAKVTRQGSRLNKTQNTCTLVINMKLALIMGLTWLFSFLATFSDNSVLWYLFIACNSLQGLFIFLSLTCTRNVCNLISKKRQSVFEVRSSTLQSNSTS